MGENGFKGASVRIGISYLAGLEVDNLTHAVGRKSVFRVMATRWYDKADANGRVAPGALDMLEALRVLERAE